VIPATTVDARFFNRKMLELARAAKVDVAALVKSQSMLLAREVMVLQQPYGTGLKQKRMLEKSVERGLRRTIKPIYALGEGGGKNEWKSERLQKLIRSKDPKKVEAALRAMGGRTKTAKVITFSKDHHKANRWKYPQPKASGNVYTLDTAQWKARLRELKQRVGMLKAGWALAFIKLGGNPARVPGWIKQHLLRVKSYIDISGIHLNDPIVKMTARAMEAQDRRGSFALAVARRGDQMNRLVKAISRGWSFAWKNGSLSVWKPKPTTE